MAQPISLKQELPSTPSAHTERPMSSVRAYLAAASAATRAEIAVEGHHQPAEKDLQILGIDHTPAYSAVVRR